MMRFDEISCNNNAILYSNNPFAVEIRKTGIEIKVAHEAATGKGQ